MAQTALSIGMSTIMKTGRSYALPAKLVVITSSLALETSIDESVWSALANATTGAQTGTKFVRSPGGNATVICKDATRIENTSGGGGTAVAFTRLTKTSDDIRTLNTETDDPILQFAALADHTYEINVYIITTAPDIASGQPLRITPGSILAQSYVNISGYVRRYYTSGGSKGLATDSSYGQTWSDRTDPAGGPWNAPAGSTGSCQNVFSLHGFIKPSVSGIIAIRWYSNAGAANPITMKAGSYLEYKDLLN